MYVPRQQAYSVGVISELLFLYICIYYDPTFCVTYGGGKLKKLLSRTKSNQIKQIFLDDLKVKLGEGPRGRPR